MPVNNYRTMSQSYSPAATRRNTTSPMSDANSGNCSCSNYNAMNKMQLFQYLNEVSFAVDDVLLYLDTHPDDQEALAYSREMIARRKDAMAVYSRRFGPLTIDCTNGNDSTCWEWILQPWPWEPIQKGGCR